MDGLERFLFFDAAVGEARSDETPGSGIIRDDRPPSLDVVGSKDRPPDGAPPPPDLAPIAEEEAVVELRRGTRPRRFPPRRFAVDY